MHRYRKNWLVIYSMMSLVGVGYFIVSASLHQFVTSSSSPEDSTVRYYCRPIVFLQTYNYHSTQMFYHSLNNMSTLKNMPTPYWGQVVAQGH